MHSGLLSTGAGERYDRFISSAITGRTMDLIAVLRTFLRVADTGSFSAVAAELGVTQPAISRQLSALEQQLGGRASAYTASPPQVPIEEPHHGVVGGARLRQLGIAEERVPHAFVHVKLRVDASLHQQSVAAQN